MEERYQIKGKIGQGGLGAVYRAFDSRMNRDVAIKRIAADSDDDTVSEEATRQLVKEASSLASLQHPNIVTVYDVGSDEDGPFVVMELISGDTLEQIISDGSFTWVDFRELAMQTMEALIAAQELNLVHRDLKPGNVMVNWLPSGKFQVKIVDFGLAKLAATPSLQTIDQSDGVFGSIYFMAPEQFERIPLDHRVDLYAIGCVFYYALTGTYPFDGEHAAGVMASHLQHHVTPLREVREGIPLWVCDWIMWHLNRQPEDRPESARQSLQIFVENDTAHTEPELSLGIPAEEAEADAPKRPKLLIPGSAPVPEVVKEPTPTQRLKTASAPKALEPPKGSKPSIHTGSQVVKSEPETPEAPPEPETPAEPAPETAPAKPAAAGAPLLRKSSATPTSASTPSALKPAAATSPGIAPATKKAEDKPSPAVAQVAPPKKGLSAAAKMTIAALIGIFAIILGIMFLKKSESNAEAKVYNRIVKLAPAGDPIPIKAKELELLLKNAANVGASEDRDAVYKALILAEATDGTDIDARIAEFATERSLVPNIRTVLIGNVLRSRANPEVVETLLDFAKSTDEKESAVAAMEAIRPSATDKSFPEILGFISSDDNRMRTATEETAVKIIERSSSKGDLRARLTEAYNSASKDNVRHAMLRLLGRIGGDESMGLAKENLQSDDKKNQIAAIVALQNWSTRDGFLALTEFIPTSTELDIRARAFSSAYQYSLEDAENAEANWSLLQEEAKTQDEQNKVIRGIANVEPAPWAFALLQKIVDTADDEKAVDFATRAIARLKDIQKVKAGAKDKGEE